MRFIRSPWWDALFIWSGIPIGLALVGLYFGGDPRLLALCMAALLTLDAAHLLSPMVLVGAHPELRQRAVAEPIKFIAVPGAFIVLATLFWRYLGPLAPYVFVLRGSWDAWHTGSQNFGLVQIYRRLWLKPGRRWCDRLICVGLAVVITMPIALFLNILHLPYPRWLIGQETLPPWLMLFFFGALRINHWTASIGLSLKVMRQAGWNPWKWLAVLVLLAASGFAWNMDRAGFAGIAALFYLNFGIAIAHYWIEGWPCKIWGRGSPLIQAALAP